MKHIFVTLVSGLALAGCEEGYVNFPVTEQAQESLVQEQEVDIIRLSSQNIAQFAQPERTAQTDFVPQSQVWNYQVGVGDILDITVFEHPELQLPVAGNNEQGGTGFQVQANGTFHYPYVGEVTASGRTPELIREDLTTLLEKYIPSPQIQVRVSGYNSQSVIVSGKVKTPNSQPLTSTPLTVLTAINAAGGFPIGPIAVVSSYSVAVKLITSTSICFWPAAENDTTPF